jgi:tetratricopeptide (TPR) repeat protein
MLASLLTLALTLVAQDTRPAGANFDYLLARVPEEMRPPRDPAARSAWAAAILRASNDEGRVEAAIRILAIDIPRSIGEIESLVHDANGRARALALDAGVRGAILAKEGRDKTRLRSLAVKAASDASRLVRRNAARLLAEVGDTDPPVLKQLASDPFYDVRLEAIRAIVRNGATITMPWIAERLRDSDQQVAELAVDVLPRLGSGGADALAPFVEDPASPLALRLRALMSIRSEGTADNLGESLLQIVRRPDEPRDLRALALALALTVGSTFDPPEAVELLIPIVLDGADLDAQVAALEGLVALGPYAAVSMRETIVKKPVSLYTFQKVLASLPRMARKDAGQELKSFFDALPAARDDERSLVARTLGRVAANLAGFYEPKWAESGTATRYEIVKSFMSRDDVSRDIIERALEDPSIEVRKAGFDLALRTAAVPTAVCVAAIDRERSTFVKNEFIETLSRRRPDATSRECLLRLLREDEAEYFESVAAALDVFDGDPDVLRALIEQHDRAYQRQLEDNHSPNESAWRVRRTTIRAIARVGGADAIEFLKARVRAERAVDEELAIETVKGLGALVPDDPIILELISPPSLERVRIEAAIVAASRGRAQGIRTLAREIRVMDSDMRRRAFDAIAKGQSPELRRGFLELLAVDEKSTFEDDQRSEAIRDLATLDEDTSKALIQIAKSDRSVEARLEAIHSLGQRGGDLAARSLVDIASDLLREEAGSDSNELLLKGVAAALGRTRSAEAVPRLLCHLFERPLRDAQKHLLDPGGSRVPYERRRIYDREREASRALVVAAGVARPAVAQWIADMKESGCLALVDPSFLLDIADEWVGALPEASGLLSDVAGTFGQDLEPRFRAFVNRALVARDKREAASFFEQAGALAASGAVDRAFSRILGAAEFSSGRRPRIWLRCAPLVARAEAAFAVQRPEEALRFLDEALRRGALDTRTLLDVAASCHSHGMLQKARDVVATVVQIAPAEASFCETFAWLLLESGDAEGALKKFALAETLDDDGTLKRSARLGAASALAVLKRADEATAIVRDLLRDDPDLVGEVLRNRYLGVPREMLHLIVSTASKPGRDSGVR